jgi:hypothetical protein
MKRGDNLLTSVPAHASRWRSGENGRIQLIQERARLRLIKKLIAALGRSDDFFIHLDEFGSAAWAACDGARSVAEIAAALRGRFGAGIEPAEERTAKFFAMLYRNRFVSFRVSGADESPLDKS